jgi:phage terminase large subunit-like protein
VKPRSPYRFDRAEADRACEFFPRFLRHIKGEWAGKPLVPDRWQRDRIIRPLFGTKRRADGRRRYRTGYFEIPKKNGKSTLSGGLANFLLFSDGEPGAEVYSAAADKEQARIVFGAAKAMAQASPELASRAKFYKDAIEVPRTGSVYRCLSADAFTKDGINPHAVIFDELHQQKNRELWDILTKSQVARRQPLTIAITTAGTDSTTICGEQHEYAENLLAGSLEDDTFLAVIYAAHKDEDWTDPKVWAKANPGLGVSVKREMLEMECTRAKASPAAENAFRRFHLNQWVEQEERWISILKWNECAGPPIDEKALRGRRCFLGIDLSTKIDITSTALLFAEPDGSYLWLPRFWVPKEGLLERERTWRVPLTRWVEQGLITATPGDIIDYDFIEQQLLEDCRTFDVIEGGFDPWNAIQLCTNLRVKALGDRLLECRQGFATLSEPTKELEARVLSRRIRHGGNPVLKWMAGNAVAVSDPAGNQKIAKPKKNSPKKVDGLVAGVVAFRAAIAHEPKAQAPESKISVW